MPLCIGILLEHMTCLESLTAWDMAGELPPFDISLLMLWNVHGFKDTFGHGYVA